MRALNREIALHEVERLTAKEPNRVKTYAREVELIEIFDDIFRLVRRVARAIAEGTSDPVPSVEPPEGETAPE